MISSLYPTHALPVIKIRKCRVCIIPSLPGDTNGLPGQFCPNFERPLPTNEPQLECEEKMPTRDDLYEAALKGDIAKLRQLVAEGADINETDKNGNGFLNDIIFELCPVEMPFRYEVVKTLLELGADPNSLDEFGDVTLKVAIAMVDVLMLKILLDAGANPNIKSLPPEDETSLDYAISDYFLLHFPWNFGFPTYLEIGNMDLYLKLLNDTAIKHNFLRPEHLLLLRSYGALSTMEMDEPTPGNRESDKKDANDCAR